MKKSYLLLLGAAALAFGSCTNDETSAAAEQTAQTVLFNVSLPSSIQSRAISDGTTVDELHYAIFDSNGTWIADEKLDAFEGSALTQTVAVQLVNGKSYQLAFWAQKKNAPYTFSHGSLTVSYDAANANDETRDAFYGVSQVFTVTSDYTPENVTLKRPFAQVNIGVSDYNEAKAQNVDIKNCGMIFNSTAYTKLDLLTGVASDPQAVTFTNNGLANAVDANGYASVSKDLVLKNMNAYHWLTMNYILVNKDAETIGTVTFTNDGTQPTMNFYQVPVQRNYRTNIVGDLLTTTADWQIIIEPGYTDDFDHDPNTPAVP